MQLVGRLASRTPWAKEGVQPGEVEELPPPAESAFRRKPPPLAANLGTPRRGGELCPLEAMLLGTGKPESWVMDWASPPALWELPPPRWEELGAELGLLEEMGAAFTEPSPTTSSLGSWTDECERADAALAAAEAQMGRGCPEESPGDATATAETQLDEDEEDWEWLTALGAAPAPPQPHSAGTRNQPPGQQEAPGAAQGPPPEHGGRTGEGEGSPQSEGARGVSEKTRSRC